MIFHHKYNIIRVILFADKTADERK